jgi:hypothetical protein
VTKFNGKMFKINSYIRSESNLGEFGRMDNAKHGDCAFQFLKTMRWTPSPPPHPI